MGIKDEVAEIIKQSYNTDSGVFLLTFEGIAEAIDNLYQSAIEEEWHPIEKILLGNEVKPRFAVSGLIIEHLKGVLK